MAKRFTSITVILMAFLTVRTVINLVLSTDISIILGISYLVALIGVIMKQKFGAILAGIIGSIDILMAFMLRWEKFYLLGAIFSAVVIDLVLIYLAYKEYSSLKILISPSQPISTSKTKQESSPFEILKSRYAKGEINNDEFERTKQDLRYYTCPYCGTDIQSENFFCANCGSKIRPR
jgi:uncharacterized membrane protein